MNDNVKVTMNTFYIVRHGKTYNNAVKRLSGWIDTPLLPEGLEPTKSVIRKLKHVNVDVIYSSDVGRAFITAYVVARGLGYADEIIRLPGLREVNYGVAANMYASEAYARYPLLDRDTHFVPDEGESLEQMQIRVFSTMNMLNEKHQGQSIVLVCHSGVMAALNANYIGQDFGAHNISEAYEHDYIGECTFADNRVLSFKEFVI